MKKGVALLLALTATAIVAASAQGAGTKAAAASAVSCKSTLKIGFVTPLTGGAGFLGTEQMSWAQYAVNETITIAGEFCSVCGQDARAGDGPEGRHRPG